MRIVQVANLVTATSGGIRTTLSALGRGYASAGHERVEVVPGPDHDEVALPDGGVRRVLPGVPLPGGAGYRLLTDRSTVRAALAALAPDAVEVHDRFTLPWVARWARGRDVPATLVVHERLAATLRTWLPLGAASRPLARVADARLLAGVDRVVVASRYAAAAFPPGDDRVQVVPFGVDLQRFSPTRRRRPEGGPLRLVVVGRLSREKRPEVAIDTVAALVRRDLPVVLDVVGDGPLASALEARARGLPVRFRGFVAPDRLARMLAGADVALAPCPVETYGLAALEALASGVPVVVPDGGALPELLDDDHVAPDRRRGRRRGLTSPARVTDAGAVVAGPAEEIAAAVVAVLDRPLERRRAAARARAERRPWDVAVRALLAAHGATPPRAHRHLTLAAPR